MKPSLAFVVSLALAGTVPASAQIAVDHQPHPFGGSASDSDLPSTLLPFAWQMSADSFSVSTPVAVKHLNWWGFHTENSAPENETMRVRLYGASGATGLPDELLHEETFANPERIATGRTISIAGRPIEYRYHAALGSPIELTPDVRYWLEVAQVGDQLSGFAFEFSLAELNSFAFENNVFPEWRLTTQVPSLAYQLLIPEPATAFLIAVGALMLRRRVPP